VLLPAPCKQKNIEAKLLPPPNQIYQTFFQIASSISLSSVTAIAKKPHWEQISKPNVTHANPKMSEQMLGGSLNSNWN
jgi:hypothetical protein